MSYPRYSEYKGCGSDWLGPIPRHWSVHRLKGSFSLVTTKAEDSTNPIALENIESGGTGRFIESGTEFSGAGIAFRSGDILFGKLRPYLAKGYLAQASGEAVGDFHVLRSRGDVRPSYALKQILSKGFIDIIDSTTYGAKMPRANWEALSGMSLAIPPEDEQAAISRFLDRETGRIDTLIAKQERLVELLQEKRRVLITSAVTKGLDPAVSMKSSGVEWLGEVPAHWEVVRLGALYRQVADAGDPDLPILSVSIHHGVSDRELLDDEVDRLVARSEDRTKYKLVAPGDLVYNMMRAWQGGFGSVSIAGLVSPAYVVARPLSELNTDFIEHQLRTPHAVEEMRRHSYGVTDFRSRLYWESFKTIRVAIPPLVEQFDITKFISVEMKKMDAIANKARRSIELMREHRTALISAAVTGKIDVRKVA